MRWPFHRTQRQSVCSPRAVRTRRLAFEELEDRCTPATLIVTTPIDVVDADDNMLSLREAVIAAADDSAQDYQIQIDPALAGATFEIASPLAIRGTVEVVGLGNDQTTIQGEGDLFQVSGSQAHLTLSNVTLTSGPGGDSAGSTINLADGASLTIQGTVLDQVFVVSSGDGSQPVTVQGDLNYAGGELRIDLSQPQPKIVVEGTVQLTGSSLIIEGATTAGDPGTRLVLLVASEGIDGRFSSVKGQGALTAKGAVVQLTTEGNQLVLSVISQEEAFVRQVFASLLKRAPDPSGLQHWTYLLQHGWTRDQVEAAIDHSIEHRQLQIREYFAEHFGKEISIEELDHWLSHFAKGLSELEVFDSIMRRHRNDGQVLLTGELFGYLLGPKCSPLCFWLSPFVGGAPRQDVAAAIDRGAGQGPNAGQAAAVALPPPGAGLADSADGSLGHTIPIDAALSQLHLPLFDQLEYSLVG